MEKSISIAEETEANMNEVMVDTKAATEKMGQIKQILKSDTQRMQELNENVSQVSSAVDNNSAPLSFSDPLRARRLKTIAKPPSL